MGLFSFDSPFMAFLGKAAEFLIICLLCTLFCLPVITVGAAVTAKYYVGMKLYRGEDVPFFRAYLKSFKDNFRQATIIWMIELLIGGFLAFDWWLIIQNGVENYNKVLLILLGVVTLYAIMVGIVIYALIARFEMTTVEAFKGALAYTYVNVPRMIFVLVLVVFPIAASFKYPNWLMAIWPVGSAAALYIISYHFVKSFKKLELRVQGVDEESDSGADEAGSSDETLTENTNSGMEKTDDSDNADINSAGEEVNIE